MCMSLLVLIFLWFVRIPSKSASDRVTPERGSEERSQNMETPEILVVIEDQVAKGR